MRVELKNRGMLARLLCALSLVFLGFAQPASAGPRTLSPEELAAYVLPDGTIPSLCVTLADGSGKGVIVKLGVGTLGMHSVAALPVPFADGGAAVHFVSEHLIIAKEPPLRRLLYPPGAGPRAPPAFHITA